MSSIECGKSYLTSTTDFHPYDFFCIFFISLIFSLNLCLWYVQRLSFQNSQRYYSWNHIISWRGVIYFGTLFYFTSTPNFHTTYVFFCFFLLLFWSVLEVMFMISLYTSNFCGCAARRDGNTKTTKLSLMFMFSLSFFLMYIFPNQYMAHNQETK